jgi:hypothetical protein
VDDAGRRIHGVASKRAGAWRTVAIADSNALGSYSLLCGVASDGSMQCRPWPRKEQAEREPLEIAGIADARAVALSSEAFCALSGDGSVWCSHGERDHEGTTLARAQKVALPERADQIAASSERVCARLRDGRVACFREASGQGLQVLGERDIARVDGTWSGLTLVSGAGQGSLLECSSERCTVHRAPWDRLDRLWSSTEWSFARLADGRIQAAPTRAIAGADGAAPRLEALDGIDSATVIAGGRDGGCALLESRDVRCWTASEMAAAAVVRDATSLAVVDAAVSGLRAAATLSDGSLKLWGIAENGIGTPESAD